MNNKQIDRVIGNLIVVNFKKQETVLTNYELDQINERVDEIGKLLDMCGDNDDDVRDNLCLELDNLIETVERSLEIAIKREKKSKKTRQIK